MQDKPTQEEKEKIFTISSDLISKNIKDFVDINLSDSFLYSASLFVYGLDKLYDTTYLDDILNDKDTKFVNEFKKLPQLLKDSEFYLAGVESIINDKNEKLNSYQQAQVIYNIHVKNYVTKAFEEMLDKKFEVSNQINENTFFGLAASQNSNRIMAFYPFKEDDQFKIMTNMTTIHQLSDLDTDVYKDLHGNIDIVFTLNKVN